MKKMRIIPLTTAAVLASVAGALTMNAKTFTETEIKEFAAVEGIEGAYDNVYIIGKHMFKNVISLDDIMTASRTLGENEKNVIYLRSTTGEWTNAMDGSSVTAPTSFEITVADYKVLDEDSELVKILNETIDKVSELKADQFTSTSYAEVIKAVALPATNDGERQEKIDAIESAITNLVPVNLKNLNDLYTKYDSLVASDYDAGSYTEFTTSLKKIKSDMAQKTYEDIETKITTIENLEKNVLKINRTNIATEKTNIGTAINDQYSDGSSRTTLNAADPTHYTKATYDAYLEALESAKEAETSANALASEIKAAKDALTAAEDALVFSNVETLTKLAETVNGLSKNVYYFETGADDYALVSAKGYMTSAGWNALKDLVTKDAIDSVLGENATYSTIDTAINSINAKLNILVKNSTMNSYNVALEKANEIKTNTKNNGADDDATEAEYDDSYDKLIAAMGTYSQAIFDAVKEKDEKAPTTKEGEIEILTRALNKAMKDLRFLSQDDLDELLEDISLLNEIDYTAGTWADLQDAIKEADAITVKNNASIQAKITLLSSAKNSLREVAKLNIDSLEENINSQYTVDEKGNVTSDLLLGEGDEYFESSWATYTETIEEAKEMLTNIKNNNNSNNYLQSDVNNMVKELQNAKTALLLVKTGEDYMASMTLDGETNYVDDEALKAYKDAVKANKNEDGSIKAPVSEEAAQATTQSLNDLKAKLNAKNYAQLKELLDEVKNLVEKQYTAASWNVLTEKKAAAEALGTHASSTANNEAKVALEAAKAALVKANADDLAKAQNIMSTIDSRKFTSESLSVLNGYVTAAKTINPTVNTYEEIQTAIDNVNNAYENLVAANKAELDTLTALAEKKVEDAKNEEGYAEFIALYNEAKAKKLDGTYTLNADKITAIKEALSKLVINVKEDEVAESTIPAAGDDQATIDAVKTVVDAINEINVKDGVITVTFDKTKKDALTTTENPEHITGIWYPILVDLGVNPTNLTGNGYTINREDISDAHRWGANTSTGFVMWLSATQSGDRKITFTDTKTNINYSLVIKVVETEN